MTESSDEPEDGKDLTADDIRRLLTKLDEELTRRGQSAVLYVVGGANISLAIDGSRLTKDLDAVVSQGFDHVFDAAAEVAKGEPGLRPDWLSADFTGGTPDGGITWQWFDHADADTPSTAYSGRSLSVELASPHMMLALKTLAGRDKDLEDVYTLMRMTGIRSPQELGRNLARFTGRRILDAQGSPGMVVHIDPTFSRILDNAPPDLRPAAPTKTPGRFSEWWKGKRLTQAGARCAVVQITRKNGVEVSRTRPCSRPSGHRGRHKFGG